MTASGKAERAPAIHPPASQPFDVRSLALAGPGENVLPPKTRQLIALAIGVALGRGSYVTWRLEHAVRAGACESEILEAAALAVEMAGDAALESEECVLDMARDIFRRRARESRSFPST